MCACSESSGTRATSPSCHAYFPPPSANWLTRAERLFHVIFRRAKRHGSFISVRFPLQQIHWFIRSHNDYLTAFSWTATTESILTKPKRQQERICETGH